MNKPIAKLVIFVSFISLYFSMFYTIPVYASSMGQITGQLLDGSNHNIPLAGQQVTLQIAQGRTTRDLTTATTDVQGNFSFNNLSTDKTTSYAVYIRYQGAQYVSDLITLANNPTSRFNLTVYQATQSTDNLAVVDATVLIHEPNVQQGTMSISEDYTFMNLANRSYVGSLDASKGQPNALLFSLPLNTRTITLGKGFAGYHVIQVDHAMASDAALLPGQNEFSFSFEIPYNAATLDLSYLTLYPTLSLIWLIPPDIHANSPQLSAQGVISVQDQHLYNRFVGNVLPVHKSIQLHLTGLVTNAPLHSNIIWLIIAILLMVGIISITWWLIQAKYYKSRAHLEERHDHMIKSTASDSAHRKQELLEEILALEQTYEAGEISKTVYQERRSQAKTQLRSLMGKANI